MSIGNMQPRLLIANINWAFHYEYIEIFTTKKSESFQKKILIFFLICTQNIDCGYSLEPPQRGGSNEYPQAMFLSRNKKTNAYPGKPNFTL